MDDHHRVSSPAHATPGFEIDTAHDESTGVSCPPDVLQENAEYSPYEG